MERRLNAELWDKMHYLFRDFNDRMVHVELEYDYEIDIQSCHELSPSRRIAPKYDFPALKIHY